MLNEADTRKIIDEQLRQVGWESDSDNLRYSKEGTHPQKGRNVPVAEWQTDSGFVDYALFVGMKMVAVIEAKANHKDISAVIDCQGKDYARNIRDEDKAYRLGEWHGFKVPFIFATNGRPYNRQLETKSGIWFLDLRRADNAPKALRGWISPTGIVELLERDISAGNEKLQKLKWLVRIEKYLLNESLINPAIFDEAGTAFKMNGGFKRIDKVFGGKLANILDELNRYLYDDGVNIV